MYNKIIKYIGIFYKICNKLPFDILKQLYSAFVHSQINYAIELYLNTCDSYFDKMCKLNNKILRLLQNKHLYFPAVELYKNFNALPPLKLHEQQIFMLLHKFFHH